jgi:putative intracellular protease/amidase
MARWHFEKAPNWQSFVVTDSRLITGQNPAPRPPERRLF